MMCVYELYLSNLGNWNKIKELSLHKLNKPVKWLNIEIKHGGNQDIPEFERGKNRSTLKCPKRKHVERKECFEYSLHCYHYIIWY